MATSKPSLSLIIAVSIIYISSFHAEAAINCFNGDYEIESAILIQTAVTAPEGYYWTGFELNRGPIILFSSVEKVHPVLNISNDDLKRLGFNLSACNDVLGLTAVIGEEVEPPSQNPIYEFYKANDPRGNMVSRIAAQQNRTALYMSTRKLEKDKDGNPVKLPPIVSARTAIHESFHSMFQFSGGFQFNFSDFTKFRRDIAVKCSTELAKPEIEVLKSAINQWKNLSDNDLRTLISRALELRRSVVNEEAKACYQNFAFWERIEGTAHFVDIKTARFLQGSESVPVFDILDGQNEFFYFTGSTYARALERLFPESEWQREVNEGRLLHEILARHLEGQGHGK